MKKLLMTMTIVTTVLAANNATAQIDRSASDLVKEAKAQIENLTPAQVKAEMDNGNVTIIDIREPDEVKQNGSIAGAINAPRGMLEFMPIHPCLIINLNLKKTVASFCNVHLGDVLHLR